MAKSIQELRCPAVPLIVHDPYFSVWSISDKLYESWPRHWTGAGNGLCGQLRVDGEAFRFCGDFRQTKAAEQLSVKVMPTRTVYDFVAGGVKLTLSFITPALPHDLDVLARPVTYISFELVSIDGAKHETELHFDCGAELCVDNPSQSVIWGRLKHHELELLSASNADQRPLNRSGDNLRIDWGSICLAIPKEYGAESSIGLSGKVRSHFAETGSLPDDDCLDMPRRVQDQWLCLAAAFKLGKVGAKAVKRHLLIAYNDLWSVEYLNQRLNGYWQRNGMTFSGLLSAASKDYQRLSRDSADFDKKLMDDCRRSGGEKYARVCALAYRQAIGAHKLVASADGAPLFLSKENFSNGCIATVDVTYPSAPLFLLTQPELLKGMMIPILDYALKPRWKFPFAPHDLGTYPLANGQIYGGGEADEKNQMPVEECGNMLLLAAALLMLCDEKDFTRKYWPLLKLWAEYLKEKGYDPEMQLCTDDFAGHLAHNTNLSLKAILALGAFSKIAEFMGEKKISSEYLKLAGKHAKSWVKDAADGDHYRLAFDQKNSWSQKYNLVWDRLLGLGIFPEEVAKTETAFYRAKQGKYGIALDNRKSYTKLDWIYWSATLTGDEKDFASLTDPLYDWLNETPSRVPMCDWYETADGRQVGFQARSVVGGIFIKLLYDKAMLKKWLPKK